ncbi:MAG TPA: histidinol dehydrogenase [Phycisphaerae bacterium]|nr:histidinol dehydrogenase [Phycisphaerae bacterium]
MLPILDARKDAPQVNALRAKLSLKPLLLEGLDEGDETATSKFATVRQILRDIQREGDPALLRYTEKFDKATLTPDTLRVPQEVITTALGAAPHSFLNALDIAIANIRRYQQAMLTPDPKPIPALPPPPAKDGKPQSGGGGKLGMKFTPLRRVGLYVPGGAAAYPSSVLHTAIPAQVAGVKELCLCTPLRDGLIAPAVLIAAAKLGITEIFAVGGAQAIAAMAFGTATIMPVDKIVGPGNTYVQLAKKELYGLVDIDSFAGPSEVIVLADDTAAPRHVAAELLAQAEHAPGSCLLITPSLKLAQAVQQELEQQLPQLSRENLTRRSLQFGSALIVTDSHQHALQLVDSFAPEHLQISTATAREDARAIQNAGAIFIGPFTPVAAGDYLAGPSHVLPTSGTARFFSGLSADSFRKRTSLIEFDQPTLATLAQPIIDFAHTESFDAHAQSVTARTSE